MDLKCEVESLNADLRAEKTLNTSLSERLQTLGEWYMQTFLHEVMRV
mgnify:CR=1 FL=1